MRTRSSSASSPAGSSTTRRRLEPLGELAIKGRRASRYARTGCSSSPMRARVRAPAGRAARRPQARARGAARGAEARGRRRGSCASRSSSARPASASRGSPPSSTRRDEGRRPCSGAAASRTATASRTGRCARSSQQARRARSATPCSPRSTPRRRRRRPRSRGSSGSSARRSRASEPLVLVFDDVHWAEPTFLELVEQLADRGEGPILVVCLAREELLEDRPSFLEDRANVERIVLDALSAEETDALLDGLGGAILESDQRARISETAEGNPFFLEQLLALALEGGLAERELARDGAGAARGPPRPARARRASRARARRGRRRRSSRRDDVAALLEPDAAPTADTHLQTLVARGFVRPAATRAFRFRHVLVQEAVYRSAPKRLRAELHERFADRLDTDCAGSRRPRRVRRLPPRAGVPAADRARRVRSAHGAARRGRGRRLGEAGIRASKRGDVPRRSPARASDVAPAARRALRARALLRARHRLRGGWRRRGGVEVLERAIETRRQPRRSEDRAAGADRARVRPAPRDAGARRRRRCSTSQPRHPALRGSRRRPVARPGVASRGLGQGGHRGQHRRGGGGGARARALLALGVADVDGRRRDRDRALLRADTRARGDRTLRGALRTRRADRSGGRTSRSISAVSSRSAATSTGAGAHRVGQSDVRGARPTASAATYSAAVLGDVELLAGDAAAAEMTSRWLCDELERTQAFSHLASRPPISPKRSIVQGRLDEAAQWTRSPSDTPQSTTSTPGSVDARPGEDRGVRGTLDDADAAGSRRGRARRDDRRPQSAREASSRPR